MTVYLVIADKYPEDHEVLAVFSDEGVAGRFAIAWATTNKVKVSSVEIQAWPVSDE